MIWQQIYNPAGNMVVSTALAAIPVIIMLAALGFFHIKAHIAAGMGLIAALVVAIFAYGMPAEMASRAALTDGSPQTNTHTDRISQGIQALISWARE